MRPLMEEYLSRLPIEVYIHDYEVDLGAPEHVVGDGNLKTHLDNIGASYERFVEVLTFFLERVDGVASDIETKQPFHARMVPDAGLVLEAPGLSQTVDHDDLRGIWASLQRGLLTRHTAEWAVGDGAGRLLSVISLLPGVRPVQIQRSRAERPEIAVEMRQGRSLDTVEINPREQLTLSWP